MPVKKTPNLGKKQWVGWKQCPGWPCGYNWHWELLQRKGKNSLCLVAHWTRMSTTCLYLWETARWSYTPLKGGIGPGEMVILSMGSAAIFLALQWTKWFWSPTSSFHSHAILSQSSSRQQSSSYFTASTHLCSSQSGPWHSSAILCSTVSDDNWLVPLYTMQ